MSLENNPHLRRSSRTFKPTFRSCAGTSAASPSNRPFPRKGDKIHVQWIHCSRTVWWSATVLSVDRRFIQTRKARGKLRYHRLGSYRSECASVQFSVDQSSTGRLVSTVGVRTASECSSASWLYADEMVDATEGDTTTKSTDAAPLVPNADAAPPITSAPNTVAHADLGADDHRRVQQERVGHDEDPPLRHLRSRSRPRSTPSLQPVKTRLTKKKRLSESMEIRQVPSFSRDREGRCRTRARLSDSPVIPAQSPARPADVDQPTSSVDSTCLSDPPFTERSNDRDTGSNDTDFLSRSVLNNRRNTRRIIREQHALFSPSSLPNNNSNNVPNFNRNSNENRPATSEQTDLRLRIHLLERSLAGFMNNSGTNISLPSSSAAILLGLKWSLLRRVEKPLRTLQFPELGTLGLASNVISIRYQCDLKSYKDMAALITRKHEVTRQTEKARVIFSPPFETIQTSSLALDNLSIAFTSLPDLACFLGIRDEKDYEALLTRESVRENSNLFQVVGTYEVNQFCGGPSQNSSSTSSLNSISATSNPPPSISLFIGCAPFKGRLLSVASGNDDEECSNIEDGKYHSVVYEQRCSHFSLTQMCFRSPWIANNYETDFCDDYDYEKIEANKAADFPNHFVLHWTRMVHPSTSKWTSDVRGMSDNCPGTLRLSIPTVYMNSRLNVETVRSLLDEHIETFMDLRTTLPYSA